ncbi:ABC transporter ATP-binding protein [Calothrix sp. FACHB-156]|nr:ABC transporter ATP-binding protein [Calothrix membranacea FACHB-236]MBD2214031.1 ABC transporter ATP-binding protein [Nostoc linckia FACHB-104]MBD2338304.1 ABC transporter ATP-binding protein [Calothrix sp. FACHB-156]
MQDAIIVQGLGKRYSRYHAEKPMTIMEAALKGFRQMKAVEKFWALRDISFNVAPGEMLGIIGKNGAGKSTLLQLLGGVGSPDAGKVKVKGRIGALLDLGAGFSPDLTGRENVFVSGVVGGLTRKEVSRRFDTIVEFAELTDFIDNPVRTYSTGMQMRLAFSIAIHTYPEVLLVDEFLSVGDISFQAKCLERITYLKEQGCAIVYISHDTQQIAEICDRALWLQGGRIVAYGEPEFVAEQYTAEMHQQTRKRTPARPVRLTNSGLELRVNENRFGSLEMEITQVKMLPSSEINSGDALTLEIEYFSNQLIEFPIFSIDISRENGQVCFQTNTERTGLTFQKILDQGKIKLHIDRLDLAGGKYFIDIGVYKHNWEYAYDYHWHAYPLIVNSTVKGNSILCPPFRWEINSLQTSQIKPL